MTDRIWQPASFLRYVRTFDSSSRTAFVQTDAGPAYLKAINNPQGQQTLACDWLGTQLARRFGLRTFDVAVLELTDLDEVMIDENTFAWSGPAFVSRAEEGIPMGAHRALTNVENLGDIPRIIVFDTWVRNCDRYAPGLGRAGEARMNMDNLFLSTEGAPEGKFILKVIDHGHILSCGRTLGRDLAYIDSTQEEKLYGLFPFFQGQVTADDIGQAARSLGEVRSDFWEDILRSIPDAWEVSGEALEAIDRFLLDRARFLADNIRAMAFKELHPGELDFEEGGQS
ncbi:MAG: HipA family kinase [Acidobacteriota bacterium]